MRPNKELKLTKPERIEASQLNSSVRRTAASATHGLRLRTLREEAGGQVLAPVPATQPMSANRLPGQKR